MIKHTICDIIKSYIIEITRAAKANTYPSLLQEAIAPFNEKKQGADDIEIFPIFIFDGESAGTKACGYNRMKFLIECLEDLDRQLREVGSQLFICR